VFSRWNICIGAELFLEQNAAWYVGGPYLPLRRNPATMGLILVNP
jgi:hypothetical protein